MFALYCLDIPSAAAILLLRCVLGSLFGGGVTGLLFSLSGGFLSLAVMALSKRLRALSVYGVSVLGAAAHNVGQIAAAVAVMGSAYVVSYLPVLLVTSVFTGLVTGTMAGGAIKAVPKSVIRGARR